MSWYAVGDRPPFERNLPYGPLAEGDNRPRALDTGSLPLTRDGTWQMSFGERAALEGILSQLSPRLAVEIGTAGGGSMDRLAAHSGEVHSIDVTHAELRRAVPDHVALHMGRSNELLEPLLQKFATAGRQVDLILIDGDHSYEGVAFDVQTALSSVATARCVILLHDTINAEVRAGIESVAPETWGKVVYYEPDLVSGYIYREGPARNKAWGGLGLILTDQQRSSAYPSPRQSLYYEPFAFVHSARTILSAMG